MTFLFSPQCCCDPTGECVDQVYAHPDYTHALHGDSVKIDSEAFEVDQDQSNVGTSITFTFRFDAGESVSSLRGSVEFVKSDGTTWKTFDVTAHVIERLRYDFNACLRVAYNDGLSVRVTEGPDIYCVYIDGAGNALTVVDPLSNVLASDLEVSFTVHLENDLWHIDSAARDTGDTVMRAFDSLRSEVDVAFDRDPGKVLFLGSLTNQEVVPAGMRVRYRSNGDVSGPSLVAVRCNDYLGCEVARDRSTPEFAVESISGLGAFVLPALVYSGYHQFCETDKIVWKSIDKSDGVFFLNASSLNLDGSDRTYTADMRVQLLSSTNPDKAYLRVEFVADSVQWSTVANSCGETQYGIVLGSRFTGSVVWRKEIDLWDVGSFVDVDLDASDIVSATDGVGTSYDFSTASVTISAIN